MSREPLAAWEDEVDGKSSMRTPPFRLAVRAAGDIWDIWHGSTWVMSGGCANSRAGKLMAEDAMAAIAIAILARLGFTNTDRIERGLAAANADDSAGLEFAQ